MTFNSLQFVAFVLAVLVVYHRVGRAGQNRVAVAAGVVFYATFDWRFLALLAVSIGVHYAAGLALGATDDRRRRQLVVAGSVVTQMGMLGFFKYADFFTSSAIDLLDALGLGVDPVVVNIVLPVGISFYSFQALAYVVAVHRGQIEPERDLWTFAAFLAWFPQILAGPIERATTLLPQLRRHRARPDRAQVESALVLIGRGLLKKVVIADGLATYVAAVYAEPGRYGWTTLVLASVGFSLQVYGDFSGYSDMARGVSRLLGVELRWNFEQPFLSRDMAELWQRWHTSLGWWFTEHVGRPLGGGGASPWHAARTTLVIFALIGLWHGAAWTFVLWGAFNGFLVAARRFRPARPRQHPMRVRLSEAPRIAVTFGLFTAGAVLFRAASVGDAARVFDRVARLAGGDSGPPGAGFVLVALVAVLVLDLTERNARIRGIEETRTPARLGGIATPAQAVRETLVLPAGTVSAGVTVGVVLVALVVFSGGDPVPFIYFDF